jgi:hypothetical protein
MDLEGPAHVVQDVFAGQFNLVEIDNAAGINHAGDLAEMRHEIRHDRTAICLTEPHRKPLHVILGRIRNAAEFVKSPQAAGAIWRLGSTGIRIRPLLVKMNLARG